MRWVSKFLAAAAVAVVGLLASPSSADAAFRMRVETGTTTGPGVVLTDTLSTGIISFSGSIGQFTLNVTTGLTAPAIMLPGYFEGMDLNNISINSTGAGTLRLILEVTGLGANTPLGAVALESAVGGTLTAPAGSSITFASYADSSNSAPNLGPDTSPAGALPLVTGIGGGSSVVTSQTFTPPPGAFSGTSTTNFNNTGTYSLYAVVTVKFTGAGLVSFDHQTATQPVPAGLVMALTGMPVLGLGAWIRRRRAAAV